MSLKKPDIIFILLFSILTLITLDLAINVSHQKAIENISKYETFQNLGTAMLITFITCVIGNLSPIPSPYAWVVCYSSQPFIKRNPFIPLLMAFIASLGCLVGEMGGYLVGRGASEVISEEKLENLNKMQKYLIGHPKLAPLLIFFFGLTPLNDDLLIVPLGLIKYDAKKTILFCWLGKFGMMLVLAYNLVNVCSLIGGENWVISIVSLYVLITMSYLFIRVDFRKLLLKIRKLNEKKTVLNSE